MSYQTNTRLDWNFLLGHSRNATAKQEVTRCPNCSDARKPRNKRVKCLSINHVDGKALCHNCGCYGFKDFEEKQKSEDYKLPQIQEWANFTSLPEAVVKRFDQRGIKQSTLQELRVTWEKGYIPALSKEVESVTFNYFVEDVIVNKKYRAAGKKFGQSPKTRNVFYNLNSLIGKKKCIIAEGEIDVLSLHQELDRDKYGIISPPNGANDQDDIWEHAKPWLADVEQFIIAVDMDAAGDKFAESAAQRLGRHRCKRVKWSLNDANKVLEELGGVELSRQFNENQEAYPVIGTISVSDLEDDIYKLYENGNPKTFSAKSNGLDALDNCLSFLMGQLTVITGVPSHGKSNWIEWYLLNLIAETNYNLSIFSPEHDPASDHQADFISKFYGKTFYQSDFIEHGINRVTREEIKNYIDWADERIYITRPDKTPDWEYMFDVMKQQVYSKGINLFLIDAWNKVQMKRGDKSEIDRVITELTSFCVSNHVHVFLVAHPTKMETLANGSHRMPNLYDVSGSADFRNQTHNGWVVYRHDDSVEVKTIKHKKKYQGKMGASAHFEFDKASGRFYPQGEVCSRYPLVDFDFSIAKHFPSSFDDRSDDLMTIEPEAPF